ncbi:RHS repeat domain-containing protein, partial [Pararcticibacter amylolyticus]
ATRTAVLNNPAHMLWSVNYYDDEGRVAKSIVQHYKGGTLSEGNYDETDNTYSFTDELWTSTRSHKVNGTEQVKITTSYEYDHMGRKVNTWETIGSGDKVLLAQNVYNEIGQLKEKRLHSKDNGNTFLQRIAYQYNERGWLKQINDPGSPSSERVFGMTLQYNDHAEAAKRQYNGNISGVSWQTKVPATTGFTQERQGYDYSYDRLNRLELASYTAPGKAGYFNEKLSYDKGGNILSLERTSNGTGKIDLLEYSYEESGQSNRLASLTDGSGSNEGQPSGTASYAYDENGNLTLDSKKQLTISYNALNLPRTVTQSGSNQTITYLYDAGGRKLRKEAAGGNRDYIDGIEYGNDGQIEFIQTEEGRAVKSGAGYSYEYMLKDHLGNTRAVVKQDGSIIQLSDYYAFGMEMNHNGMTPSPDNKYKYNGKELQTELGMNQYDYGARFYDPVIGRW